MLEYNNHPNNNYIGTDYKDEYRHQLNLSIKDFEWTFSVAKHFLNMTKEDQEELLAELTHSNSRFEGLLRMIIEEDVNGGGGGEET